MSSFLNSSNINTDEANKIITGHAYELENDCTDKNSPILRFINGTVK